MQKTQIEDRRTEANDEDNRNLNGLKSVPSSVDKSFTGNSLYLWGLGLYMLRAKRETFLSWISQVSSLRHPYFDMNYSSIITRRNKPCLECTISLRRRYFITAGLKPIMLYIFTQTSVKCLVIRKLFIHMISRSQQEYGSTVKRNLCT